MTHENSVHTHAVEALPGPSYGPSVMADIGGRFGAVVLHTPETLAGLEIEIRPVGASGTARTPRCANAMSSRR